MADDVEADAKLLRKNWVVGQGKNQVTSSKIGGSQELRTRCKRALRGRRGRKKNGVVLGGWGPPSKAFVSGRKVKAMGGGYRFTVQVERDDKKKGELSPEIKKTTKRTKEPAWQSKDGPWRRERQWVGEKY